MQIFDINKKVHAIITQPRLSYDLNQLNNLDETICN
jgi:hypothetical protein